MIQKEVPEGVEIEMTVQHPTGSFHFDFLGGMTNVYQNITNVIARISHKPTSKANAVLLSAHYDSALGSPAATDDLCNIAGMIELLRALAHGEPLEHAVVFNFNGGEETINQAAHGFITKHEWAPTIRAFINMEGSNPNNNPKSHRNPISSNT